MTKPIYSTKDAGSGGGTQAIRKITGTLLEPELVENKFDADKPKDEQRESVLLTLADATILEVLEGEETPELTDGNFVVYYNYKKKKATTAHKNTFWVSALLASAEKVAKARGFEGDDANLGALIDTVVTMEFIEEFKLFSQKDKQTGVESDVFGKGFVFVDEDSENADDLAAIVTELVVGKKKQPAMLAVMRDNRLKKHPEYKEAITAGTLPELVPTVKVDDSGVFQLAA